MPLFHFDIHSESRVTIDDGGIDLAHMVAAEALALESLGQAILDDARNHRTGVTKVEVRDAASRVVLTALAAASILRSPP
ncbi:DUF6894 family protein [Bradyrhizobium sp. U531]|uniref:DUF6894 family protein n=1 Tax=Bradyrhizobium sp. U531 TaxID=3053458 RepID=UPI003F682631